MKTSPHKGLYCLVAPLCLLIWVAPTNAGQEPRIQLPHHETWGGATNGLAAGVLVTMAEKSPNVTVLLRQVAMRQDERELYFGVKNIPIPGSTNVSAPQFYLATNGFCGPIELRDIAGSPVQLRNSYLAAAAAYPDRYNIRIVQGTLMSRYISYSGPPLPTPLMSSRPQLATFQLEDAFVISSPGEYTLTVWPKIYKRISPTNDLCQRIDLPPVSLKVKVP